MAVLEFLFQPPRGHKSKCVTGNILLWPGTNTARFHLISTHHNTLDGRFRVCLLNRLSHLVAKNSNGSQSTLWYGQGSILPRFIPFWTLITSKTAILGFRLQNKLGPLVAKNPNASQGTFSYCQGPTLPSFIPIWSLIRPLTSILLLAY